MYLKLAWRNIWRNISRTFITLLAVSIAVILSVLMMSAKNGVYENMIKSLIGDFTGFAQIQSQAYVDDSTIDNALQFDDDLLRTIQAADFIDGFSPRIENFALAVSDSSNKGVMIIGIDVEKEKKYIGLNDRLSTGQLIEPGDDHVMLGSGLSERLRVGVGDTVVLLSQGYHGSTAAGKYLVKGIVNFGSPELSNQLVFLPIEEAQTFYDLHSMYTNIILHLKDNDEAKQDVLLLNALLNKGLIARDWEDLAPELKNMIETDKMEGYVFMFILYMVIAFGLFGTMLMMLSERKHEFGVLVAIGMKRIKLAIIVWLELLILSILGVILGSVVALPICNYFHQNPIYLGDEMKDVYEDYGLEAMIKFSLDPSIFTQQAAIILIISSIIAIFPFIKLLQIKAIQQMNA